MTSITLYMRQLIKAFDDLNTKARNRYGTTPLDLKLLPLIRIDLNRLGDVICSCFLDVQRCAAFHKLYDSSCPDKININQVKEAGFLAKWFMNFTPIVIPNEVIANVDKFCKEYPQDEYIANGAKALSHRLVRINEYFITGYVLQITLQMPPTDQSTITTEEWKDLIYMLTYRCGRQEGTDLSLLFYWIQQTAMFRSIQIEEEINKIKNISCEVNSMQAKIMKEPENEEELKEIDDGWEDLKPEKYKSTDVSYNSPILKKNKIHSRG